MFEIRIFDGSNKDINSFGDNDKHLRMFEERTEGLCLQFDVKGWEWILISTQDNPLKY